MAESQGLLGSLTFEGKLTNQDELFEFKISSHQASWVAQRQRICLQMWEALVWSLIWAGPKCCGATKPMYHNYWACALEPGNRSYWSLHALELCALQWEARTPQLESRPPLTAARQKPTQQWRSGTAKNKQINKYNYNFLKYSLNPFKKEKI